MVEEGKPREVVNIMPFRFLNVAERMLLSQEMNPTRIREAIGTFVPRDYRGLAQIMGFTAQKVQRLKNYEDPTENILFEWEEEGDHTIGEFLSLLETLGRYDVIDDLMSLLGITLSRLPDLMEKLKKRNDVVETSTDDSGLASFSSLTTASEELPIEVVSRETWQASPARDIIPLANMVKLAVVHQIPVTEFEDTLSTLRKLQKDAMERSGSNDIAYNFLIDDQGVIFEGTGWDRVCGHSFRLSRISISIGLLTRDESLSQNCSIIMSSLNQLLESCILRNKLDASYGLYGLHEVERFYQNNPEKVILDIMKTWPSYQRLGEVLANET